MSTQSSTPVIPTSPAVLSSNNTQTTAGSRESSEFEFVGNNGSGNVHSSGPPATLQPDESSQIESQNTSTPSSTGNADVLDETNNPNIEGSQLPGLFGWVRGTGGGLLSKVAEKTKSSMETVITTLDPQVIMKLKYRYTS